MVDVTEKGATKRTAVAAGALRTSAHVVALISTGGLPKGDALATARVAAILAAKRTSDLYSQDSGDVAHAVREWAQA